MDLLSRTLSHRAVEGVLKGVRIAPRATPLTNSLYADDLLLFGAAEEQEAIRIMQALKDFESVSGQIVGPEKSTIWFSEATTLGRQMGVARRLGVSLQASSELYLGAPISAARGSYEFLLEKVSAKLNMWKSKTLTPAGRLVLIKAALQSIPIYYMATAQIPKKVLVAIETLARKLISQNCIY